MYGTIADYEDITNQYLNCDISLDEYGRLLEERSKELQTKQYQEITHVNKEIISNSK